jgi:hypothetical protein
MSAIGNKEQAFCPHARLVRFADLSTWADAALTRENTGSMGTRPDPDAQHSSAQIRELSM